MKNVALRFGPSNVLVGVVHLPAKPALTRQVGVLILSAGVVHRAGPNRMHTALAIRLANHGFTVLRFDYSSIGDSDVNPSAVGLPERNIAETQAGMDVLTETYGLDRFILIGLCSGADNAFRVAHADPRVVGVGLLDGYAYHTKGSLRPNLVNLPVTAKTLLRWGTEALGLSGTSDGGSVGLMLKPPRAEAERDLVNLAHRGVQVLCVYTPEFGVYKYADQFFDFFPEVGSHPGVRVEFFEQADHIFTSRHHQTALSDLMAAWAMETSA